MKYENTFKAIDLILWKEQGCGSELDYLEQKSWMLFLKYLDDLETEREEEAELDGKTYKRPLWSLLTRNFFHTSKNSRILRHLPIRLNIR